MNEIKVMKRHVKEFIKNIERDGGKIESIETVEGYATPTVIIRYYH